VFDNIDKKKIIIVLVGVLGVVVLLTLLTSLIQGDGSKLSAEEYEKRLKDNATTILNLQQELDDAKNKAVEVVSSSSLTEINGVKTFRTINDKFILPTTVEVPDSTIDSGVSRLQVGSRFVFIPSESWVISLNGVTVNLSHSGGITGSIKALKVKNVLSESDMTNIIRSAFDKFPTSSIEFRKLFIDDRVAGISGSCITEIDNKPFVVTIGYLNRSENALMFGFKYDSRTNSKELVDLFIRSGTFGTSPVRWE
jgi:hypothetical protein